ncbi:MAG TPA: electron transfer flavoprotein subunit alpha/FixB family protein [Sulfuricaulis sp.]|nr:electron transfer flavoprotein subunit alpha/FixB family protein [Sulfuricaulis sp.]
MPGTILVVAERTGREIHPATWDAVSLAWELKPDRLVATVPGPAADGIEKNFETRVHELWLVEHPRLADYSAELHCLALQQVIDSLAPDWVFVPHTYQGRDFAPRLAARYGRSLIADCNAIVHDGGGIALLRPLFQGKLNARVRATGNAPRFVGVQPGSGTREGEAICDVLRVERLAPVLDSFSPRTRSEPPQHTGHREVDLTRAEAIVAVGRGIGSAANVELARRLAGVLGAELAASRPVCDEGWLPMERQIGSSGLTVSPKLYVAIGISGAIQHLAGMRGAGTIVAINKDPRAPIFRVADVGVVGDLHEILPALIQALESRSA